MKKEEPQITTDLREYIDIFLGDSHYREHKYPKTAEIIEIKARNTFICYIQWKDEYDKPLRLPVVWSYAAWADSEERRARAKKRSEEQRVERFIFEANTKIVAKACERYFNMDNTMATATAISMLRGKKVTAIKEVGVNKLIESESEL